MLPFWRKINRGGIGGLAAVSGGAEFLLLIPGPSGGPGEVQEDFISGIIVSPAPPQQQCSKLVSHWQRKGEKIELRWFKETKTDSRFVQSSVEVLAEVWRWRSCAQESTITRGRWQQRTQGSRIRLLSPLSIVCERLPLVSEALTSSLSRLGGKALWNVWKECFTRRGGGEKAMTGTRYFILRGKRKNPVRHTV